MMLPAVLLDLEYTMLVTRQKTCIALIFACLLTMAISVVQSQAFANCTYSCNFEVEDECQWSQDSLSDNLNWLRNQGHIRSSQGIIYEGPFVDHTKGSDVLKSTSQGPGALQFRGGKCIHVYGGGFSKPVDGRRLVIHSGCSEERLQFELGSDGILTHTKHKMCVKPIGPVNNGVKVGVYRNCNKSDTWSWTKSGSLQYQKKKCLTAKNGVHPVDEENLVLSSVCDQLHNFIKFVPIGSGWYLYMKSSRSSNRKDRESARFFSPNITEAKSCLQFYYRMFGQRAGSLQVYVSSEGSMGFPLKSFYGPRCRGWNRAQVAVNNQTTTYQYVIEGVRGVNDVGNIVIDDICVRDSCSEPLEPEQQPNYRQQNNSQLNATTPPFVKEQKLNTSQLSATTPPSVEEQQPSHRQQNNSQLNATTPPFVKEQKLNTSQLNATIPPSVQVCKKANISSEVSSKLPIFIAVNLCVLLLIVVINIIVLVKCRRRDQKPKVLTQDQDNISLTVVESLQGP